MVKRLVAGGDRYAAVPIARSDKSARKVEGDNALPSGSARVLDIAANDLAAATAALQGGRGWGAHGRLHALPRCGIWGGCARSGPPVGSRAGHRPRARPRPAAAAAPLPPDCGQAVTHS